MSGRVIKTPKDIDKEEVKQLPDRTNLSKLYPTPATPNQYTRETKVPIVSQNSHKVYKLSLVLGFLIGLPPAIAVFLFAIVAQNIRASNTFVFLPIIVLSLIILIFSTVYLYAKVASKIRTLEVNATRLLTLHLCCLALILPPLYAYIESLKLSNLFLQSLGIASASMVLMWVLFSIISSKTSDDKKAIGITIVIAINLTVAIVYLFTR